MLIEKRSIKNGKLLGYVYDGITYSIESLELYKQEKQNEGFKKNSIYEEILKAIKKGIAKEDPTFLSRLKKQKTKELKQRFLESLKKDYVTSVSENRFYSEERDISKLKNAYDLAIAAGADVMKVKTLDGRIELSVNDVKQALLELGEYYQSQLQKLWDLEEQVNKAQTEEEIEAIKWEN